MWNAFECRGRPFLKLAVATPAQGATTYQPAEGTLVSGAAVDDAPAERLLPPNVLRYKYGVYYIAMTEEGELEYSKVSFVGDGPRILYGFYK